MFFRLCSNDVSYHLLNNKLAKFAVLLSHLYKNSIQVNFVPYHFFVKKNSQKRLPLEHDSLHTSLAKRWINYRKLEQYFIDFNENKSLYKDITLSRGSCLFCCFATNKQGQKTCSYVHVNELIQR